MAEMGQPRKKLIIKFYLPSCETEKVSDHHSEKRRKLSSSKSTSHEINNVKDSRIVSKACELKNKKGYFAVAMWVNAENPPKSCGVDSRKSTTEFDGCKMKDKNEGLHSVECKKREEKGKVMMDKKEEAKGKGTMDRCKKMQCWAILKRLMVGRDGWALKQPLLDNSKSIKECLGDIESKLKKFKYSKVDEFSHDIRLVFSYALQYPPRNECHRTLMRIRDTFEMKDKNEGVHGVECNKREKRKEGKSDDGSLQKDAGLGNIEAFDGRKALKQHIMDKSKSKTIKGCLEDNESKLKKLKYSKVDEFAHDIKLVFSYAVQYLPRSEVHRTATRIKDTFKVTWKTLKYK
ncbi:Transcription factor GTE12, partial [Mucuna pruriens]